jgi:uncharacterized protein YneF (UPF0154 family)
MLYIIVGIVAIVFGAIIGAIIVMAIVTSGIGRS